MRTVRCLVWAWMAGSAVAQGAPTTPIERERAWRQAMAMARVSPFAELRWRAVGPRHQGGRIEAIACHPDAPAVLYVGAGSGNLWKTVNHGTTWTPVFDAESTFAIGDVAIAPSNPSILWVGTGERLMARSSYAGTGVYLSADGGASWRNMGLKDTHHIGRVLIHPKDPSIVYVAAIGHLYSFNEQRGLFRTKDGGRTWQKVLYVDEKTGVIDVTFAPDDPNALYATTWERDRKAWGHVAYGAGSGLHKSVDGGDTWRRLTNGLPVGEHVGRTAVAVAPSDARIVYAAVDCAKGSEGEGVYRSADAGATWTKVNRRPVPLGYDFCMLRVGPDDPDELFVPGQRTLHSTDGGKTYWQIGGTLVHLLPHDSKVLHLDAHALWIDPGDPKRLILGNDGGLHISYDRGKSWLHYNNLPIGEFYAVSHDGGEPYRIFGGTQDNAAVYGPSNHVAVDGAGTPWRHVYLDPWGGGDSYETLVSPDDPDIVYYEHQFGFLRRKRMSTGETVTIQPRLPGQTLRFNWMMPFCISHHDPKMLYCGAQRMLRSRDRGDSWLPISGDLSKAPKKQGNVPFGTLTTISESRFDRGTLCVGTDDGNVHVTRDDGKAWERIDGDLPEKWVSRVLISQHDKNRVFVTMTGYREDDFRAYVYRSDDAGRTWRSIVGNLPAESVNVIDEDPKDPAALYLGTDLGCYVSVNGGQSWHSLRANLPTTPVHDLFVHGASGELVIGTHGRSIFVLDIRPVRRHSR